MKKSYEEGISDCLAILNKWTDIGVYDVPIKYIRESMEKLLNTTDPKELKPDITKDPKISREVYNNPYEMEYNV